MVEERLNMLKRGMDDIKKKKHSYQASGNRNHKTWSKTYAVEYFPSNH